MMLERQKGFHPWIRRVYSFSTAHRAKLFSIARGVSSKSQPSKLKFSIRGSFRVAPSSKRLFSSAENGNDKSHISGQNKQTTVESILESTQEWNKAYVNMEANIMHRIHTSNKQRFRVILLTTVVGVIWVVAVFGGKLRKMLTRQTADLAKETLENKSLQIQTQELATAVVQTVLNDKEVTLRAATFIRDTVNTPETRDALLALLNHVLQHPETNKTLSALTKAVIADITADQETIAQVASLLTKAFADEKLLAALSHLVTLLCKEPEVVAALTDLSQYIVQQPIMVEATNKLLSEAGMKSLESEKLIDSAKEFVADVVQDDWLQRESGDALWSSVRHALVPGLMRFGGFCLLTISIGLGKIMLHPY